MPLDKPDKSIFSLRLPDKYRKLLEQQATRKGWSVGQQIVRIIEIHLMQQGYGEMAVTSNSGRLFEIIPASFTDNHDMAAQTIRIIEPKYEHERAFYCFGVDRRVMRDWRTSQNDREMIVQQVAIALLNFYNRLGHDLDRLSWNQVRGNPERRILLPNEVPETFDEFRDQLLNNNWNDQYLIPTAESQDILDGRKPEALWRP